MPAQKERPQVPSAVRVSPLTSHLRTSITVEIVSLGPSRATIEARPERAADRAPAHGRTSLPPRGPVGCCRRGARRPRRLIGKCRAGAAAGNVSAEGEAIRSNDYRKDTTVKAPSTRPAAVLGLDVGKSSHWACLIDRDGEVLASAPVRNREAEPPGRPRPPPPRPRRRSSRPRTGRSGSWPPGYRRPSTRPGPSRPRRRRCSRATRPTRACSPCPASARGPRRSSRCRSTSGGSRTTTTWPRTAA